jgi:hypothetical protein
MAREGDGNIVESRGGSTTRVQGNGGRVDGAAAAATGRRRKTGGIGNLRRAP